MNPNMPLITPDAIRALGTDALPAIPPDFLSPWMHQQDEGNPVEGITTSVIGEAGKTETMHTSAMQSALVLEATRFKGSITTNRNTKTTSPKTTWYGKIIFPDAAEDNMPLHRLFGAAEAGEKISRDPIIPTDLRGAPGRKSGGPSKKAAWETVYGHCKRYAEQAAEEAEAKGTALPFTVDEYLANLTSLYEAATAWPEAEGKSA